MSRQEMDVANHTVKINYSVVPKWSSPRLKMKTKFSDMMSCGTYKLFINQSITNKIYFHKLMSHSSTTNSRNSSTKQPTVVEQWAVRKWTWQTIRWKDIYMQCISEVLLVVTLKRSVIMRNLCCRKKLKKSQSLEKKTSRILESK